MFNKLIFFGIFLISTTIEGVEILTPGFPFIATYATSINSHIINHNVQTPIIPARLIQPAQFIQQPTQIAQIGQLSQVNQLIQPQLTPSFGIHEQNVESQRGNENYQPNDERNESIEVESAVQRSLNQQKNVENSAKLQDKQESRNELNANIPRGFVFHSRVITDENLSEQNQIQKLQRKMIKNESFQQLQNDERQKDYRNDGNDRNGRSQDKRKEQQPHEIRLSPFARLITFNN